MMQPDLISAELQKFIDVEFAKLKQEVAEAFSKQQQQHLAEQAAQHKN